jgi:hypothetical protein
MRSSMLIWTASACLLAGLPAYSTTAQQDQMTTCNASARTQALTGDAPKAFMKTCLSGG